ncbi:hypothetical protein [Streptomyces sp. NPDC058272]|uniref:hypothetical protein n=1 Tax=Streptomyces sp. NPDC058272 TaxID=3346415 RepID=UPI0036EB45BF
MRCWDQLTLEAPWGQVTCRASQLVVKAACQVRSLRVPSVVVGISADGADQVDAVVLTRGQDVGGGDVSGVHHMLARLNPRSARCWWMVAVTSVSLTVALVVSTFVIR